MENYPQLVPLIVFIPLIGMVINLLWGARLGERWSGLIGSTAAILSFVVALLLWSYLNGSGYQAVVVNPPFFGGWIQSASAGLQISWQQRVDTLSVTMMLVVTGVGSLIHIYAIGYMHGDPRFSRFFAYLNMFFVFMLILVTGNNFLMMFVGWEGVGLCSFLLIGFWFDRPNGVGWKNSLAARKAMILNRIGDFGILMAIFLMFWTFGTLDFYRPGEIANVSLATEQHDAALTVADKPAAAGETASSNQTSNEKPSVEEPQFYNNDEITTPQLGVFGQAERMLASDQQVNFGPFSLPIKTVLVLITLFMLLGATGKSAQIPLFVWLPDAMAGPTPVSALIHAATMVTAGVYMMVRANVFFANAEFTSLIVAIIGALTAIVAGYIAIGQWDIKRVLAYSTISQLGFMVAAVGVGAYQAAMFHLVTHAFFKALLFLGSGSVIHGMEHGHHNAEHHAHEHGDHDVGEHEHDEHHQEEEFDPQDMRNMGGLKRAMPLTYLTYLIGTLALAGIFPFAGFWSKDEILASSWLSGIADGKIGGYIAFAFLLVAAAFTAFYMWRQMELVFYGKPRTEAANWAQESTPSMVIPLLILGFLSIFGGMMINMPSNVLGLDHIFSAEALTKFLEFSVANIHPADFQLGIALIALALAIGAIFLARSIYGQGKALTANNDDPLDAQAGTHGVWAFANARMYWDQTYNRLFENPFNVMSHFLADTLDWAFWHDYFHNVVIGKGFNAIADLLSKPVDLGLIDGTVNSVGRLAGWFSSRLRRAETGYIRTYAVTFLLGVVLVVVIILLPLLQR